MNKTLSFTRLDFLTIKPYFNVKTFVILSLVFVYVGYLTGSSSMIIGMLMMYSTFYMSYPFAIGDKNGMDILYASLPISKSNVVSGRYIFALLLNVLMAIIAFTITLALMVIFKKSFSIFEMAITVITCFILYSIIQAVQLPIFFSLGYTKAKFLSYLPLLGFPAVVIIATSIFGEEKLLPFLEDMFIWMQNNIAMTLIIILIIWTSIMVVSILVSSKFYKKREF